MYFFNPFLAYLDMTTAYINKYSNSYGNNSVLRNMQNNKEDALEAITTEWKYCDNHTLTKHILNCKRQFPLEERQQLINDVLDFFDLHGVRNYISLDESGKILFKLRFF